MAGAETPEEPEIPICAAHVYEWWWELNSRRSPGFDQVAPITYADIHAWAMLTEKTVSVREVRWLIKMDNAWIEAIGKERESKREREKQEADLKAGRA